MFKIGYILYKKDKKIDIYYKMAQWCNENNAQIEERESYFEITENKISIQDKIKMLEIKYNMNRWQREGILAKKSSYSKYVKKQAQEIEDLAKQIRK